ncbi:MAG: anhydro-N-acetylmuramic acid kinase [Gemmatimonadetes bacterium]|nr:anhydro-N-acetylmuramic acid kinase [Gemmatimonadota bacterium]
MRRFVGLMSGTSVDAIDAVLMSISGQAPDAVKWQLDAFRSDPFDGDQRSRILDALTEGTPAALTALHADLGEWFAEAVRALLGEAGVTPGEVAAIGSHGQTIWHIPPSEGRRGSTLQLGDPATIAARTEIDVISDFRSADVAAGGHGAPLVPWPDRVLLAAPDRSRLLLNLGGMANLTWLPPRGGDDEVVAFDTGPGNVLLDAAAAMASHGRERCDVDGRRARAGTVDPELLGELLADRFYDQRPPRSTGRETFGPATISELARRRALPMPGPNSDHEAEEVDAAWAHVFATLTELTAVTVADAVARWVAPRPVDEVVLAGGGARNPALVAALERALAERDVEAPVRTGADALGIDPDAREAAAFALLAWAHLEDEPGNEPGCTGASARRVLGSKTPAPRRPGMGRPDGGSR